MAISDFSNFYNLYSRSKPAGPSEEINECFFQFSAGVGMSRIEKGREKEKEREREMWYTDPF